LVRISGTVGTAWIGFSFAFLFLNPNIIILLIRVDVVEWPSFAKNGPLSQKKLVCQEKEGHFPRESGPKLIVHTG
jgi:hypothetical protein